MRSPRLLFVLVALLVAAAPAAAHAKTFTWLCKPGLKANPCGGNLTASVLDGNENVTRIEHASAARHPKVDCFYVYPTVSSQKGPNATLAIDPEETMIARYQASRFSQDCRMYAPIYRQLTVQAILDPKSLPANASAIAYAGVRDAWRTYLSKYNKGRGVVLIGHSQGSFVLRQLMRQEIDKKPAVRRRIVSALLMGGNVLVKKHRDVGGDFQHIPACRRPSQTGCVVAYSTFNATPPADAQFGRVSSGFGSTPAKDLQVLCTNPGALAGGSARLRPYDYAQPFPGLLGVAVNAFIGPIPKVSTPWIAPGGRYDAHCSTAGGASFLLAKASQGARDFVPNPNAGWGWHLGDINLALGNLTTLVKHQVAAYLAKR